MLRLTAATCAQSPSLPARGAHAWRVPCASLNAVLTPYSAKPHILPQATVRDVKAEAAAAHAAAAAFEAEARAATHAAAQATADAAARARKAGLVSALMQPLGQSISSGSTERPRVCCRLRGAL